MRRFQKFSFLRLMVFVFVFLNIFSASVLKAESSDIQQMTEVSERRLRQSLEGYLGKNARFVVTVYFDQNLENGTDKANSMDVNPWIISGPYLPQEANLNGDYSNRKAEVEILLEKETDLEKIKSIEKLAKNVLRGAETNLIIRPVLDPLPLLDNQLDRARNPASEYVNGEASKVAQQWIKDLMPLAVGILIFIGLFLIGRMLQKSAQSLAEGISSIRPQASSSLGGTLTLKSEQSDNAHEKSLDAAHVSSLPPFHGTNIELKKNLEVLEKCILETPTVLLRCLEDDLTDRIGLRFLVSKVSENAKNKLKEVLGVTRLVEASSSSLGSDIVGFDTRAWIQQLVERIEIKRLSGGNVVEEALNPEEALLLSAAPHDQLFECALKINRPETWRVATDYLSSDYLKKRSKDLDDMAWKQILVGSRITETSMIRQSLKSLIEGVRLVASESAVMSKYHRESKEHFVRRVLPSLIDAILARDLGEDDKLIEELGIESRDYVEFIWERVWTPSRLDLLSDDQIASVILKLDSNERKAYLISALPQKYSERLLNLLPEGNQKKIIKDIVARLKNTTDQDKQDTIKSLAREFLDYLRIQVLNGSIVIRKEVEDSAQKIVNAEFVNDEDQVA